MPLRLAAFYTVELLRVRALPVRHRRSQELISYCGKIAVSAVCGLLRGEA